MLCRIVQNDCKHSVRHRSVRLSSVEISFEPKIRRKHSSTGQLTFKNTSVCDMTVQMSMNTNVMNGRMLTTKILLKGLAPTDGQNQANLCKL